MHSTNTMAELSSRGLHDSYKTVMEPTVITAGTTSDTRREMGSDVMRLYHLLFGKSVFLNCWQMSRRV